MEHHKPPGKSSDPSGLGLQAEPVSPLKPPPFSCDPAAPKIQYTLEPLLLRLKEDKSFGPLFADRLKQALIGNLDALKCIEAWYQPSESDLYNLGVHTSRFGSMSRCTDAGLLLLGKLKTDAIVPFD